MSILIKGMEMPKDCVVCPFGWNGCNHQHDFVYMGVRPSDCPLVPAHPHGRLIDADALIKELTIDDLDDHNGATLLMAVFLEVLKAAPTIIPADKEGQT